MIQLLLSGYRYNRLLAHEMLTGMEQSDPGVLDRTLKEALIETGMAPELPKRLLNNEEVRRLIDHGAAECCWFFCTWYEFVVNGSGIIMRPYEAGFFGYPGLDKLDSITINTMTISMLTTNPDKERALSIIKHEAPVKILGTIKQYKNYLSCLESIFEYISTQ